MANSKPRDVFVRVLKRSLFVQLAFMCAVYGTSDTPRQMMISHLICLLTLLIAVLSALYFAGRVEHSQHEDWLVAGNAGIHYPSAASFQEKVTSVEEERRRRKPINEYV